MSSESDAALAAELAAAAGARLLALRGSGLEGRPLAKEGDRVSQELLADALGRARPQDAVLSEEAVDDVTRLVSDRVWIVDPLDGTREYSEGRHDWAVHVALWEQGDLGAAAVALPGRDVVLRTDAPPTVPAAAEGPLRIAVSRTRPPAVASAVADATGAELVPMGSAGYKVCAVALGEVDAYLHAGGQYEWDSAAPVAVARAAGLHTSRIDGSPLRYNQPDPSLPDLLVARPEVAGRVLDLTRRFLGAVSDPA
jgi:3'(2'), 5'-bisphosphate nucleotidase